MFQKLDTKDKNSFPYLSDSQAITTYCLKMLARYHIIEIVYFKKRKGWYHLHDYESCFGNNREKENISMYDVKFYKIRNLTKEDIPLLQSMAALLKIDFNCYRIKRKNKNIVLFLKEKEVMKASLQKEADQRALTVKENLNKIRTYLKEDFLDIRKEQYKLETTSPTLKYGKNKDQK